MPTLERLFNDHLFPLWLRYWKVQNSFLQIRTIPPDLIVLPSYATCEYDLALSSEEIMRVGIALHVKHFPKAQLAVTTCQYVAPEKEETFKRHMLGKSVAPNHIIWARNIRNTVDEADRIREETISREVDPKVILIVTGEMHSRSAKRVYHKIFPNAKILITCLPLVYWRMAIFLNFYQKTIAPQTLKTLCRLLWCRRGVRGDRAGLL